MKNTLFLSSALMAVIWVPVHFTYHMKNAYLFLILAAIIVLIRLVFNNQLDRF